MVYDHTQRIEVDERLVIRPYRQKDAEGLFPRLLAEKEELFMINSIDKMNDISDLRAEIDRVNALLREGKRLGGAVELDGRIVGSCRIAGISIGEEGDLGYWLFREARGKGIIVTEKCLFRGGRWWDAAVYVMSRERWAELRAI